MNESINQDTRRFDCNFCRERIPRGHRLQMLCGWERRRDWPSTECTCDSAPDVSGHGRCPHCLRRRTIHVAGCRDLPTVCPGYSTKLPAVIEAVRAWSWWDKGQLALRWPDPDDRLMDDIELFNGQRSLAQQWELEERQRRAKNGGPQ